MSDIDIDTGVLAKDTLQVPVSKPGSANTSQVQKQKTFINRAEYMKSLKFPQNSQNLVIIPSNEKGTGFLRTCYNKEILDGVMGQQEFQSIVDGASNVVAKVYSQKRLADTRGIDQYKKILSFISVLLALIFLAVIYIAIEYDNLYLELAAYAAIIGSFIIMLPLSLYELNSGFQLMYEQKNGCFGQKKFINFNKSVKKQLDDYFDKINQNMEKRGVNWGVEEGHYWIECKVLRENDNFGTVPTTQPFFMGAKETEAADKLLFNEYFKENQGNAQLMKKPMSRNSEPEKEDQISSKSRDTKNRRHIQLSKGQGIKVDEVNIVEKSKLLPMDGALGEAESFELTDRGGQPNNDFKWNNQNINY